MKTTRIRLGVLCLVPALLVGAAACDQSPPEQAGASAEAASTNGEHAQQRGLNVHYLEIVTPSVDETCEALARAHGVEFTEPVAELGNARTADLKDGGRIGVRAPMRETETPIVRPYVLVDDIQAAVKAAEAAGATIALPPMDIPGQGTFAIYILGGIEHGLWQI